MVQLDRLKHHRAKGEIVEEPCTGRDRLFGSNYFFAYLNRDWR